MAKVILSNAGPWSCDMLGVVGVADDLVKFISDRTEKSTDEVLERFNEFTDKFDQQILLNDLEIDVIAEGSISTIMASKEIDDMPDVYVVIEI